MAIQTSVLYGHVQMLMIKKIPLSLFFYVLMHSSSVSADTTVLTISGRVMAPTCSAITVNNGQPVDFKNVSSRSLIENGFTNPIDFVITFDGCHTTIKNSVAMAFSASTVPESGGSYIELDEVTDSAQGIAIGMKDQFDNDVVFNGVMGNEYVYLLQDNQVNLPFKAYLVPVNSDWSGLSAGHVRARATFVVEYR